MPLKGRIQSLALLVLALLLLGPPVSSLGFGSVEAQESGGLDFDWDKAMQVSVQEDEGLGWNEGITASFYGNSGGAVWGGYGNRLRPAADFFCALPGNRDSLDCLGGHLACRVSRCGEAQPDLDEVLSDESGESGFEAFEFWPGDGPDGIDDHPWIVEGDEGDGLFRVIEIKPSGRDEPMFEAYVGDVGPWCNADPYWETYSRPDAEDGVDARGRITNRAGIDVSYALAQALGCTGLMLVDWRWKTVDGAYVVRRQATEWRW